MVPDLKYRELAEFSGRHDHSRRLLQERVFRRPQSFPSVIEWNNQMPVVTCADKSA